MAAPTDDDERQQQQLTAAATMMAPDDDVDMARLIPSTLPLETRCRPFPLRQLSGFWLPEFIVPGVTAVHTRFEPRPDDVFLASFPKSGTTWLKALAFAVLSRGRHPPSDPAHPLRRCSPHDCVRFLELVFALDADGKDAADVFASLPSPRVLATHLPYHLLPERVAAAGGRVVYVCRDPKDALVSAWVFTEKAMPAGEEAYRLEDAFELFCDGRCVGGPQWRHVLGYWEASRRWPDKVLFLRYEDMLRDPADNVRRLAAFLGCPFSADEDEAVDAVVELCSLESMKASKASRSGGKDDLGIENRLFFRKGAAGDWRNHLTLEMAQRLDGIVAEALQGSGFTFGASTTGNDTSADP